MKMEYLFVRKKDDFCQTVEQFMNHLLSNGLLSYVEKEKKRESTVGEMSFSGAAIQCSTVRNDAIQVDENIFYLIAEVDNGESAVDILGNFDRILRRINQETGSMFQMNTIWDDVSDYYRKALYPSITKIENLLRKIIYRFMILNVGQNWFTTSTPKKFKDAVEKVVSDKENLKVEIKEDHLLHADFVQLGVFFFGTYTIKPIDISVVSRIQRLLEKADLKPEDYQSELCQIIKDYESKSNWERFFSKDLKVERLEEKWNKLYGYRNQVAHSKRMTKSDYDDAQGLISSLKEAFEGCLRRVDRVKMSKEESEAVVNIAADSILFSGKKEPTSSIQLTDDGVSLLGRGVSHFSPSTTINEDGTVSLKVQPVGIESTGYFTRNQDGNIVISDRLLATHISDLPMTGEVYVYGKRDAERILATKIAEPEKKVTELKVNVKNLGGTQP